MDFFYIFIAFFGTCILSISFVYSKLVLSQIKNPVHMLFLQISINFILLFLTYLINLFLVGSSIHKNLNIQNIIIIFFSAVFIFIGLTTFFIGLHQGNVSTGGMIMASRVVVSVIIANLFLGELFPLNSYLYILLVYCGVLLVSWNKEVQVKDLLLFKSSSSGWYILAIIFFAIGNGFIRLLSNQLNIIVQLILRLSFLLILTLLTYPLLNKKIGYNKSIKNTLIQYKLVFHTFVYVMLIMTADIAITTAIGESLTITETIAALGGLIIFILLLILGKYPKFKEYLQEPMDRKTLIIRFLGIITATIAIIGFISIIL